MRSTRLSALARVAFTTACLALAPLLNAEGPAQTDTLAARRISNAEAIDELKRSGQLMPLATALAEARYAVRSDTDEGFKEGLRAFNSANGFTSEFDVDGLNLNIGPHRVKWRLARIGYGSDQQLVPSGSLKADGQRVEIVRRSPEVTEWFVNRATGLEHGFTLPARIGANPTAAQLQVAIAVSGNLTPKADPSGQFLHLRDITGQPVLTYSKLKVWDATGRVLPATMTTEGHEVQLRVNDTEATYPLTIDPTFSQQAYLKASNSGANDQFGWGVDISGNTAVVGAFAEDSGSDPSDNNRPNSGAVYVFVRIADQWVQQAFLKASNADAGDEFGYSVAISGDTIVASAIREDSNARSPLGDQSDNSAPNSGAAYVFTRTGTNWTQQAYLKAHNSDAADFFGFKVDIDGETIVVSAHVEDSDTTGPNGGGFDNNAVDSGAVYVFVRSGTNWVQQAYLKASNTEAGDLFGRALSISGDLIAVGSMFEDSNATGIGGNQNDNSLTDSGAAYVFRRSGTNWTQEAYIKASNVGIGDNFASTLAVSGNTLVVGADADDSSASGINGNQNDNSMPGAGSAYVFAYSGTVWSQQAYLKASNPNAGDYFGDRVGIDNDTILIGAVFEDSGSAGINGDQNDNSAVDSGAVYVFKNSNTVWKQIAYIKASNPGSDDAFGSGNVAISGTIAIFGSNFEDSQSAGINGNQSDNSATDSGAAYIFDLAAPENPSRDRFIGSISGTGSAGAGGDAGPAVRAALSNPIATAIAPNGDIVIADSGNSRIRRIESATGLISTFAGTSVSGFGGDGGDATNAQFNLISGISFSPGGDLLVADTGNHRIRRINGTNGLITTIAGAGTAGFSGDGGLATTAELNAPTVAISDTNGNLYIADTGNHRIRRVDALTGFITTIAGTNSAGFSGDGGSATGAVLSSPQGLAIDHAGSLLIADTGNNRVRRIGPANDISTFAGGGTGVFPLDAVAATASPLNAPKGLDIDGLGRVYIADSGFNRVRVVDTNGAIHTVAGDGTAGFAGDGGPASDARLKDPSDVTISPNGNVIIADTANHRVRRVTFPDNSDKNLSPGNSINLLTGTDLSKFQRPNGAPVPWQPIGTNALEVIPGTGNIVSTQLFNAFRLHAEFMTPTNGQDGNSGIFLQGRYEVQIFNSFGVATTNLTGNDCGAIWGQTPAATNACLAPGEWQSYDIEFYPPQWNGTNKVLNARATVVLNGILVQDNVDIPQSTQAGATEQPAPGPLLLQDNGSAVRFRNVVITPFDTPPAVEWVRVAGDLTDVTVGNDRATATAVDRVGNVFVTGQFRGTARFGSTNLVSNGGEDVFLAKYAPNGDLLWATSGGGPGQDIPTGLSLDPGGAPVITGSLGAAATFSGTTLTNAGQADFFVAKYATDGALAWAQAAGGPFLDLGEGVSVDGTGAVLVTGRSNNGANFTAFIIKFAPDGNLIWSRSAAGAAGDTEGLDIVADERGGAYVVGETSGDTLFGSINLPGTGSQEAFLLHIDGAGDIRWVRRSSGPGAELATGVARDRNGFLYVQGWSSGVATFGGHSITNQGGSDSFALKSTPDGSTVWLRQIVGTPGGAPQSLAVDAAGALYVTANYNTNSNLQLGSTLAASAGAGDAVIAKYDTDGTLEWTRTFGGTGDDFFGAVALDPRGSLRLVGSFSGTANLAGQNLSSVGVNDLFIARLESTLQLPAAAQWRFDDASAAPQFSDQAGTFSGQLSPTGAVFTAAAFSTNALAFLRNTNGFADLGELPFRGFDSFTLSLLVRTAPGSTNHAIVLSRHDVNTGRGFLIGLNGLGTNHHPGSVLFTPTGRIEDAAVSARSVNDGRWHSVTVVYSPFSPSRLYIDGQPDSLTPPVAIPFEPGRLIAGGALAGGVPFGAFDGGIDELVIYNRGLSAAEIGQQALYPEETVIQPPVRAEFQWVREVNASGGSTANAVDRDGAGNLYVTGKFAGTADFGGVTLTSRGSNDVFIAKYDPAGTLLWAHQAGGAFEDEGVDLTIDNVGNVVVCGSISGLIGQVPIFFDGQFILTRGARRGFLAKYSSTGSIILAKELWGPATAVDTDSNGNLFVGGNMLDPQNVTLHTIDLTARGLSDIWYARFSSVGNALWAYTIGGSGNDRVAGLRLESDGAFYLTGDFTAFIVVNGTLLNPGTSAQAPYLFRLATLDGSVTWARQGTGTPFAAPHSLLIDQGGVQIAGQFFNAVTFGNQSLVNSNNFNGFAARHDIFGQPNSAFALHQNLSASLRNGPESLYFTGDFTGTTTVDGLTYQDGGQRDMLIIRRDAAGTNRLVKHVSSQADIQPATGAGLAADPFGNVYVTGTISRLTNAPPVPTRFDSVTITPTNQQTAFLAKMGSELRILRQPNDLVATNLDGSFLRVLVDGAPPLSYQWYHNGTNALQGPNGPGLSLDTVAKLQPGSYHVVVSNSLGYAISAAAQVSLELPPIFEIQPTNTTVELGLPGFVHATMAGNPPLTLQWYHNGNPLTDATNETYSIPAAALTNAGLYQLFATNQFGWLASDAANLTVLQPGALPEITTHPQSRTNALGSQASFSVSARGQAPLFYQWYKNGVAIPGRRDPALLLSGVQFTDAATYQVVVTNQLGSVSSSNATLTVFSPSAVAITSQPVGTNVLVGQNVTLSVTATGSPVIGYQWLKDSAAIPGATASILQLDNVTAAAGGAYSVQVFNDYSGTNSVTVPVNVRQVPVFTQQPQSVVATNNQFTTFQTTVAGLPAPVLRWYKDGVALTNSIGYFGVDSPTLTIPAAGIAHIGTYYLQASNSVGLTLSSPALLGLNFPPRILTQPQPASPARGTTHTFSLSVTGAPPIQLLWVKDGMPLLSATNANLVLTNLTRAHSGIYYLTATNQNGGTVSSNALLRVIVPQRLGELLYTNAGFQFLLGDADGSNFTATNLPLIQVQLSSNLIHWDPATNPLIYTNGQLLYRDDSAPQPGRRYYRVIEP